VKVLSKFGLKSIPLVHNYLEETEEGEEKKERKKNRGVNSLYHSETPTVRIFSVVDYRNVLARNSRIITEKCSARARSARTSMQHAIDRKAIRSGLSVALFITLPGSLLRGSTSQTIDRVSSALTIFSLLFLSRSLFSLRSSHIPFILPLSSFTASKVFFRENREICSIQVKVKEPFHGSKYFHTRCGFSYSWQTSVTRFARRCRNRPARCCYQTEYAHLRYDFFFCKLYIVELYIHSTSLFRR